MVDTVVVPITAPTVTLYVHKRSRRTPSPVRCQPALWKSRRTRVRRASPHIGWTRLTFDATCRSVVVDEGVVAEDQLVESLDGQRERAIDELMGEVHRAETLRQERQSAALICIER
jgi:hypothetical protein